jgi:selenoprotein W-related protein
MQQGMLDISIEYCAPCGYIPRVLELTAEVMQDRSVEAYVRSWKLIPSRGGVFEVTVNGELVFSKKALGRHAEAGEIKTSIETLLNTLRPAEDNAPNVTIS